MAEKLHLVEHDFYIKHSDREGLMGQKSGCLWFTGLSGSGKSTIANKVEQELFARGFKTYILDGDSIRKGLNIDLTFTNECRNENIRRIAEVTSLLCDAGLVVLACFISPFEKDRQRVKSSVSQNFTEIFVDAPIEVCEKRDVKGLYKKARCGDITNFTGISSPFEAPVSPDIHIKTDELTIEQAVLVIIESILPKIKM